MRELRKAIYLECKYQTVCKAYLALCHADYTSRWAFLHQRPSVVRYVNGALFK